MKTDNANEKKVGAANSPAPAESLSMPATGELSPSASAPQKRDSSTLSLIDRHRIESLKRKQRSDSFLHTLTDEQIAKVLGWFQDEEDIAIVHHYITAAPPEGLGLEISTTSVRRLRAHITATQANHRATEILDTIIDMEADADLAESTRSERIQSAINQLLHQKAFELARTAPGAPELFEILAVIERLSALDLKRQKIALDRENMLRRNQRASRPPFMREHKVELKIVPATHSTTQPALSTHEGTARQPVEIIAPLPEVVL